jgi:uncharacterized phage infection (PIP) family protein YhgE
MLDDPNVIIFNREPLLQEQVKRDHVKGVRRMQNEIKQIEAKLAETKAKLIADESELTRLREQRAQLVVRSSKKHAAKIEELDTQIEKLRNFITNTPACIAVLQDQLQAAKAKYAAENRDALLNSQKEITKKAKELSKELVRLLAEAVKVNNKLQEAYSRYQSLHDLTKIDFLGSKFAEPSLGMLNYLYDFLKAELEEGKHERIVTAGEVQI